ncbi:MAG: putative glycoside hydrolase [Patescibacteria group bacterium]
MRRKFLICTALIIALFVTSRASDSKAAKGINGSPKIINLFLNWQLREEDLQSLARWDVVVLDADQQARYPARVKKLKELNPNIKILAYLPSEEIANTRFSEPAEYPFAKMASRIKNEWYIHDPSGNKAYFWPGSALLNVTDQGSAAANGQRWNDFLPYFIKDEILSTGLWDGVFLDNTFEGISHYAKGSVDLDRNGQADEKTFSDEAWRAGMKKMLNSIHELSPSAIIIGNGGAVYSDQLNGAFFEHFPSWNWTVNWQEFRDSIQANRKPSYTALNVNTDNQDRQKDYKLMRFGLGNAMVGGGYYSFDKGDYSHDVLWWYDEYEISLGASKSEPQILGGKSGSQITPAVWARTFENGIVVVNTTNSTQKVPLPGVYEKLKGVQDPVTNDGSVISTLEIKANDGIILLRRSDATEIREAVFQNGSFVRIYDIRGRQTQSGFFAQRSDVKNGNSVMSADLDGDFQSELMVGEGGRLTVSSPGKKKVVINPFGSACKSKLSLATGQTNRDKDMEIITACDGTSPSKVRIFSRTGTKLAEWSAYAANFTGGIRVGVGDLDGDGKNEIVTGAGTGGGPHVKIWKTDGKVWGGGFFAFDSTERGGVSIAVGDVDGDNKDEIIAGSGQGSMPRVRIYSGQGKLKAEISLGDKPLVSGVQVATSDMNGDGVQEILVSQLPIF